MLNEPQRNAVLKNLKELWKIT